MAAQGANEFTTNYPWGEIKEKYETGKYSMPELAEEYGFSAKYGQKKAREKGWEKGKTSSQIAEAAAKKAREEEVETEAELRRTYDEIMRRIRDETVSELFDRATSFDRLKQLKISTQILKNTREEQWEIGLFEKAQEKIGVELDGGFDIEHQGSAAEAIIRAVESNREREGDGQAGSE